MPKLSVVIITYNEEKHIGDAVRSAMFADEVLVLDSGSTDKTVEIARSEGARVEHQEWLGFGRQKREAVTLAKHEWVFVLDSDERILPALREEIAACMHSPQYAAYNVPRLNRFWGKTIKSCGLYPDYSLRLFDRTKGNFNDVPVHESVQIEGPKGCLQHPMEHLAYESVDEFIDKQNRYSTLHHRKRSILKALCNPPWTFFRLYVLKRGFMDGWDGYMIARLYAQYTFWKYVK